MKWSDTAWKEAKEIYKNILEMPFNQALADGSFF